MHVDNLKIKQVMKQEMRPTKTLTGPYFLSLLGYIFSFFKEIWVIRAKWSEEDRDDALRLLRQGKSERYVSQH